MALPFPAADRTVVILSGAGLSAASGIPTFRDADGLWEGHDVQQVATPHAWTRTPGLVRRFYDERRVAAAGVEPNAGHEALADLQREWGTDRVVLVTQNIDGLLTRAGALDVIEMHGSLWRLRCEWEVSHPTLEIEGEQDEDETCPICQGRMRPDVVWFGEVPYLMDRIQDAMENVGTFLSIGTSGVVYPAAGLSVQAKERGALSIEVNPNPCGGLFDYVLAEGAEKALPMLVEAWLAWEGG